MEEGIPTGLSRGEARRFGLVVGSAFLVFGALSWWRHRMLGAQVFGAIGTTLMLLGALAPAALRPVHRVWMGVAAQLSKVTTPIVLAVVYFVVIAPIGLVRRLMGKNSLKRRPRDASYWVSRVAGSDARERMERQF